MSDINPKRPKRSSLKNSNPLNEKEIMNSGQKRNSVSFQIGNVLQFKANFVGVEDKKIYDEHEKKFKEARRKSIKNEFQIAKDLLKNDKAIQEIENEDFEEIQENTNKNINIGKELES